MFIMQVFIIILHVLILVSVPSFINTKEIKPTSKIYHLKSAQYPEGYVDGIHCKRPCGGKPMKCYFNLAIEAFYAMSKACYSCPSVRSDCFRPDCIIGGGIPRTVWVMNRQMPAPGIEVCEGDKVLVHMENHLENGESVTLHFHGMHMRGKDAYSDGVPFVTQCPVLANNNFTYKYTAVDPGTHWYHSHIGMQRGDGMYGPLIVRTAIAEHQKQLYDKDLSEHIVMVGDWTNRPTLDVFKGFVLHGDIMEPSGILVNGLGYQFVDNVTNTPLANFIVEKNVRYRFRFINVGFFNCPVEFSIDGHQITIIASDGHDIEPVNVNSFVSNSGERYDFVIHANQNVSTYWVRVKGYVACERLGIYTVATLQYKESNLIPSEAIPTYENSAPIGGVILNPMSLVESTASKKYSKIITISELRALVDIPLNFDAKPDYQFYVTADLGLVDNPEFNRYPYYGLQQVNKTYRAPTPQFNHIAYMAFDRPVLPNRFEINHDTFCNEFTLEGRDCANELCTCTHVLHVPLNSLVEFIFIEEWNKNIAGVIHPIHLHGYAYRVLGWGELGRNNTKHQIMNLDKNYGLPRNYQNPVIKDTVSVARDGYTIVRFIADNPGFWFLHCHIDVHSNAGMDLILKVGENTEMPDVPDNFPKCGN